ncbi:MAG: S8 family peptidase [Clostridiales bacterium]|nr:S8 family peptidase [Clostridiales bacterium]
MPLDGVTPDMPLEDFIMSPYTAAFIIRSNDYENLDIRDNPYVRVAKTLSGDFVVCYARIDLFDDLLRDSNIFHKSLSLGPLSQLDLEASSIVTLHNQPYVSLKGNGALLGFVDTGIDYTKPAFCWKSGETKIKYLWDQSVAGVPPRNYNYGTEYDSNRINEALNSQNPNEIVPQTDKSGHGTFLASVACSHENGTYMGAAPEAELIVVRLRKASSFYMAWGVIQSDTEEVYEAADLMMGVEYIIERAHELGRPVVICIALGTNLTGHDGFNVMDDYLTGISYQNGVCVCCAVGNEADKRHHASGVIEGVGESKSLEITVGEDSPSFIFSVWNNFSDRMSVSITSPLGEVIARVPPRSGTTNVSRLIMEQAVVNITYIFPFSGNSSQVTDVKIVNPTPGIWKLTVYGDIILDGTFDIWLPLTGLVGSDIAFLSPSTECSVTAPATALGVISVGAYNSKDKSIYASSSIGPTRSGKTAPDLIAPGVDVGGIFPDSYGVMTGTSVACAIVAGACALLMQWGLVEGNTPSMNTYYIKTLLIQGCDRDANIKYPHPQYGYGRLNLYNTFLQMRSNW